MVETVFCRLDNAATVSHKRRSERFVVPREVRGETLRLYANGEFLVEVQDDAFPAGDIDLIAGTYEDPGTDILFGNLVVTEP